MKKKNYFQFLRVVVVVAASANAARLPFLVINWATFESMNVPCCCRSVFCKKMFAGDRKVEMVYKLSVKRF